MKECGWKQEAFLFRGSLGDFYAFVGSFLSFGDELWVLMAVIEWP